MLEELTNEQLEKLVADHWREIKGLLKEIKRRHVLNTNPEALDSGHRNGRTA